MKYFPKILVATSLFGGIVRRTTLLDLIKNYRILWKYWTLKVHKTWKIFPILHWHLFFLQKVHTFQASLEAVLAQLCDAEQSQKSLTASANLPQQDDPTAFRNQLKVKFCAALKIQFNLEDVRYNLPVLIFNNMFSTPSYTCLGIQLGPGSSSKSRGRYQWSSIRLYQQ